MFGQQFGQQQANSNPNQSIVCPGPPSDSVSALEWSPQQGAYHLLASSWDKSMRFWQVQTNGEVAPRAVQQFGGAVLDCCWSADGSKTYAACTDGKVMCWDMASNQQVQVGMHPVPVRSVQYVPQHNLIVTGSWDKTLKYWDSRSPNPAATVNCSDKIYCMDVNFPLLVACTADKQMLIFNLQGDPSKPHAIVPSPLQQQFKSVKCFSDKQGFIVGSIEGRAGIHYISSPPTGQPNSKNFTFKCHRENQNKPGNNHSMAFTVNDISFHPMGTFATCGGDGRFCFWDKDNKQRLKEFAKCSEPISAGQFSMDGNVYAYSPCYDWYMGAEGFTPQSQNSTQVLLHAVQLNDIKPNPNKK